MTPRRYSSWEESEVERMRPPEDHHGAGAQLVQGSRDERDDQQADGQGHHEQVRHHRRHQEVTATHGHAMEEDHRHGVLEHGEREAAEEQHQGHQQPADDVPVRQERTQFADQHVRSARHDEFEAGADRGEHPRFVEHVRQREHHQDQQRHQRQQRVVRHRAGQQQALVGAELLDDGEGELARMAEHLPRTSAEHLHAEPPPRPSRAVASM